MLEDRKPVRRRIVDSVEKPAANTGANVQPTGLQAPEHPSEFRSNARTPAGCFAESGGVIVVNSRVPTSDVRQFFNAVKQTFDFFFVGVARAACSQ
jgi:hypothetical protein